MATQGKLSEIVAAVYATVEGLTPRYEAHRAFQRWRTLDDLATAEPSLAFRSFQVRVPNVKKGSLQDSGTKRSKAALVQVCISYPQGYLIDGDDDALGVEVLRPDDDALIVDAHCFKRPLVLQDQVSDVRSIKWLGSALSQRLWVISLEIEYLETIS
jgi:hypothetical protein